MKRYNNQLHSTLDRITEQIRITLVIHMEASPLVPQASLPPVGRDPHQEGLDPSEALAFANTDFWMGH